MIVFLLALQAAAASAPDIELNVRATARSVEIESKGKAELSVRAEPDAGSQVRTNVTPPANGATRLNNVQIDIHAEARISAAQLNPEEAETSRPE